MRLALDVTPLLGPATGVGGVTNGLFGALVRRRDIEVVAYALSVRGYRDLAGVVPASTRRNRRPMPAGVLSALWKRTAHPKIERWTGRVDIVHGTNFVVPPTRGRALVTVHDLTSLRFPEMCEPRALAYPALIKSAVGRGAHVHTFSQYVAEEVHELLDVPAERIHVVAPGFDRDESRPVDPALVPNGRYLLAIGTVEPRKNYPALVRAFDAIAGEHSDVRLVIAGSRGWGYDQFISAVKDARYSSQITFAGRVSAGERNALLNSATALIYPSIYEGFGVPPIEAMGVGVPVVAARSGAIPEVVGDAALLVDPYDSAALSAALVTVLGDDSIRKSLIEAGYLRIANMGWNQSADRFVQMYQELVA